MNRGFQIEIQKGLTLKERRIAIEYANWFIKEALEHGMSWKHLTDGGWNPNEYQGGRLRRGGLGWSVWSKIEKYDDINLVFRRASKNRRIFQIIRRNLLGHELITKTKVQYGEIPTEFYCRYGEIKG